MNSNNSDSENRNEIDLLSGYTNWLMNNRVLVFVSCILVMAIMLYLAMDLRIDVSIGSWFRNGDKSYTGYKKFTKEFGNDEFVYILYTTENGVFDKDVLYSTRGLVSELEKIPYIRKVNAITNLDFIEGAKGDEILIYNLLEEFPENPDALDLLVRKMQMNSLFRNIYFNDTGSFGGILCQIDDEPEDNKDYKSLIHKALLQILSDERYKEFEFWPVGQPVIYSELNRLIEEESKSMSVISFIAMSVLLLFFFRNFKGFIGPYTVYLVSLIFVLGFMGGMEFPVTSMFPMLPSLLMAIGTATSVHIIKEYQINLNYGYGNKNSVARSLKEVGYPCLFTSLTTAVGFGSMIISPILVLHEYGIYVVFGVISILIVSFTLLPVFLSVKGNDISKFTSTGLKQEKKENKYLSAILAWISSFDKRHYRKILVVTIFLVVISIFGVTKLQVNSSYLELFGDKVKVTRDYKLVDRTMGGGDSFEVVLNSSVDNGATDHQFVKTLESIQNFADSQTYLVKKTISIVDIIKSVNQSFNNNDNRFYKIPDHPEGEFDDIIEYIFEVSGLEDLERMVSQDISSARLTIMIKSTESGTSRDFYNNLNRFIKSIKPDEYSYNITGLSFLTMETMRYIEQSQISSIVLAFFLIAVMMIFLFKSFKIGMLSMIPNISPVLITLGFMGYYGIWLDYGKILISCLAIGLAVDDTIHLIFRFKKEYLKLGNYNKALDITLQEVGSALTITTVILVIGFGVAVFSDMKNFQSFGLLTSMCISIALLADFFIAPALILFFKPFEIKKVVEENNSGFRKYVIPKSVLTHCTKLLFGLFPGSANKK